MPRQLIAPAAGLPCWLLLRVTREEAAVPRELLLPQ
jgi:hypothetical protein